MILNLKSIFVCVTFCCNKNKLKRKSQRLRWNTVIVTISVDLTEQTYTFFNDFAFYTCVFFYCSYSTNFWFFWYNELNLYSCYIFCKCKNTFTHYQVVISHRKLENCLSTNVFPILPFVIIQAFNEIDGC